MLQLYAKEINVSSSSWADFVFEDTYRLRSLSELEEFIQANGHLPDIPSEKEVISEGVNLAEMNKLLLQKVEELTLYLINQNKKFELQEAENRELKKILQLQQANIQTISDKLNSIQTSNP
jgi:hypothetical protein